MVFDRFVWIPADPYVILCDPMEAQGILQKPMEAYEPCGGTNVILRNPTESHGVSWNAIESHVVLRIPIEYYRILKVFLYFDEFSRTSMIPHY